MFEALRKRVKRSSWLYLQYILYLLMIIGSTIWAYGRLVFVRDEEKRQSEAIEQYDRDSKTRLPESRRVR